MAGESPLSIVVVDGANTHTYMFSIARRPTLMALSCLTGPRLFVRERDGAPYTAPWMPLSDLPRGRVAVRNWTDETIARHNDFFIQQLTSLVADLDERLKRVRGESADAASMRQLQSNLRATIERERRAK